MSVDSLAADLASGSYSQPASHYATDRAKDYCLFAPAAIASALGLDLETYSLARMMASEGYDDPSHPIAGRTAAAIIEGQAIINEAARRKQGITQLLVRAVWSGGAIAPGNGFYGPQGSKLAGYRYASTDQDPLLWHVRVAQEVMSGTLPDLARGAVDFLDPSVFKSGVQHGIKLQPVDAVLTKWANEDHKVWIGPTEGIDPFYLLPMYIESDPAMRTSMLSAAILVSKAKSGPSGAPGSGSVPEGL